MLNQNLPRHPPESVKKLHNLSSQKKYHSSSSFEKQKKELRKSRENYSRTIYIEIMQIIQIIQIESHEKHLLHCHFLLQHV